MRNALCASLASLLLAVAVFTPASFTQAQSLPATPATPKRPVVDKYQGVTITDDYRWLENWDDPEVKQWNACPEFPQSRIPRPSACTASYQGAGEDAA